MPSLYIVENRITGEKYHLELPWVRGKYLTNVFFTDYKGQTLELRPSGPKGLYSGKVGHVRIDAFGDLAEIEQGLIAIATVNDIRRISREAEVKVKEMYPERAAAYGAMLYMNHFLGGGISAGFF